MAKGRGKKSIAFLFAMTLFVASPIRARAEALPDVLGATASVADCVMSYMASAGAAIANTDWIDTLYNSLGPSFGTVESFAEQGMLVLNDSGAWEPVAELTTAIENTSAYASLGLGDIFNVSAAEAAAGGGVVAASGAATLSGAMGGVASTGVLPLLGGVTAAYWGGIALGTIASHMLGLYQKPIEKGVYLTTKDILESLPNGSNVLIANAKEGLGVLSRVYYSSDVYIIFGVDLDKRPLGNIFYDPTLYNGNKNINLKLSNGVIDSLSTSLTNGVSYQPNLNLSFGTFPLISPVKVFSNISSFYDYVSSLRNGDVVYKPSSPDVIGENGNVQANNNNGNITIPDFKPNIDVGTQAAKPLSLSDWLDFANGVQNNNNQTNPLPDNAEAYGDIMDALTVPKPSVNPDDDPNQNPNPNPVPTPTPVPTPDYPDPNPDQPQWESETNPSTEPIPDQIPTGKPWVVQGLEDKFPFCIPWDIAKVFSALNSGSRQAPYIHWRFNPPNTPIDYTFELDLEDFENVAELLRLLELGAFIVGLAWATRYLIGSN